MVLAVSEVEKVRSQLNFFSPMFGWLKSLTDKSAEPLLVVEGYRLETTVKLAHPIRTPGGSRVTLVSFCVNVHYSMDEGGTPVIRRVQLWQPDENITGVLARCNVFATYKGEAWHSVSCEPESLLNLAVQAELALQDSRLRRIMVGRWRAQNHGKHAQSIVDSLNNRGDPEQLAKLINATGYGKEIAFTYAKSDGTSRTRKVSVIDVTGHWLRAQDLEDSEFKTFRLDQISNARVL